MQITFFSNLSLGEFNQSNDMSPKESINVPKPMPPIIITPRPIKTIPVTCDPLDFFLSDEDLENIRYPGIKKAKPININIIFERKTPMPIPNPVLIRDFMDTVFLAILLYTRINFL